MFKKEKILMSLVVLMLVVCVFGSVHSLATEITATPKTNTTVITPITATNNNTTNNNTTNNTNLVSISGKVNTVKANNVTNSSKYNNVTKTNSTKLPYAGTDSSLIFIVIAFAASAIYAYKKVSEYNV